MNKKAMAIWEVLIWAIILSIVAFLLIYNFKTLFGKETDSIDQQIGLVTKDSDGDGVRDVVDKCTNAIPNDTGSVDSEGCTDKQRQAQQGTIQK